MILRELVRYYDRKRAMPDSDIAPPGWIRRPLDYVLVLAENGSCVDLLQTFELDRGKPIGQPVLLPAIGKQALKHTNSGKDANLLWDNASFVLGIGDRGAQKLKSFEQTVQEWFGDLADPGIKAVGLFLSGIRQRPERAVELIARATLNKPANLPIDVPGRS